jgi:organic hydroperoxide reductase OsmC/OhrA
MRDFPHCYAISATTSPGRDVELEGPSLPSLVSAPPVEFDGPGDRWSPETLIVAAVADCFVLTFKAFAKASTLEWQALTCDATGTLDRVDGITQFTAFTVNAWLQLPPGGDETRARRLLDRAENACLVTNSLKGRCQFNAEVYVVPAALAGAAVSVSALDEQC